MKSSKRLIQKLQDAIGEHRLEQLRQQLAAHWESALQDRNVAARIRLPLAADLPLDQLREMILTWLINDRLAEQFTPAFTRSSVYLAGDDLRLESYPRQVATMQLQRGQMEVVVLPITRICGTFSVNGCPATVGLAYENETCYQYQRTQMDTIGNRSDVKALAERIQAGIGRNRLDDLWDQLADYWDVALQDAAIFALAQTLKRNGAKVPAMYARVITWLVNVIAHMFKVLPPGVLRCQTARIEAHPQEVGFIELADRRQQVVVLGRTRIVGDFSLNDVPVSLLLQHQNETRYKYVRTQPGQADSAGNR